VCVCFKKKNVDKSILIEHVTRLFRGVSSICIICESVHSSIVYTQNEMQSDAERTLHNLHVLAVVSHNDKLMTNDDLYDIYAPTSLRGLFRAWYGEKRACNLQRVRSTIRSAMTFASKSLDDATDLVRIANEHNHMRLKTDTVVMEHVRMCDGIECAKLGLQNLARTYRDDSTIVSQLQLLISEIDHFLALMQPHTRTLLLQHKNSTDDANFASQYCLHQHVEHFASSPSSYLSSSPPSDDRPMSYLQLTSAHESCVSSPPAHIPIALPLPHSASSSSSPCPTP